MNSLDLIFRDISTVLKLCTVLLVISQLLSSIEFCYIIFKQGFSSKGYCPWYIVNLDKTEVHKYSILSKCLNALYSNFGIRLIIILKLLFLITLLFSPIKSISYTLLILFILSLNFFINYRCSFGGDGSDQMGVIVIIALFFGAGFFANKLTSEIAVVFIASQSSLSYVSAGVAKLVSKKWRSGSAVYEIFNTGSYGAKTIATAIAHNSKISFFLSWNVMVMECLFPVSIFLRFPFLMYSFLLWGTIFHLFNALIMGLNSFFWIFLSTYPCILYLFYWFS